MSVLRWQTAAAACYESMLGLAESDRSAAIANALAGARLFQALRLCAPEQPQWVLELEEQCCRYGAIWIHQGRRNSRNSADLERLQQGVALLDRLAGFHSPPPEWIAIHRQELLSQLGAFDSYGAAPEAAEELAPALAETDLIAQAAAVLEATATAREADEARSQILVVAVACHQQMLSLAERDRAAAINHALAGAQLLQELHGASESPPDWVSAVEEQCCRYGAIWIHEQLSHPSDAAGLRTWCQQAVALLERLDSFHTPPPEWITTMRQRFWRQLGTAVPAAGEQLELPPVPEQTEAAEALLPQARDWLPHLRAAGAHEQALRWLAQFRSVLGDRPELLWFTLDSAFPLGDWGLQAWCAEQLLNTIGPEHGPVHRHLLLTRWQALLNSATLPEAGQPDLAHAALLALASCPPEADSCDPAMVHSQAWLWLQSARLAQRRGYLQSAKQMYQALADLPVTAISETMRDQALEMVELIAYVLGDLEEGHAIRRQRRSEVGLIGGSHSDPFRHWRMELAADRGAMQQWQTLRRLPPQQRLTSLATALEAHPNATVLAFGLLHSLRDGDLLGNRRLKLKPGALIPRRLWLLQRQAGISLEREERQRHWLALHPGWDCEWLQADPSAIDQCEGLPALVRAACRALNAADVRADLLRLALLWEYGGLSLDWDTRPQQSLAPLVEPGTTLLLVTDHLGCLGLDAIAAIPRHPLVRVMLEEACRRVLQGEGFSRWELSGAALLSSAFAQWIAPLLADQTTQDPELPAGVKLLLWSEVQQWLSLGIPLSPSKSPEQEQPAPELIDHPRRLRALQELRGSSPPAASPEARDLQPGL